MSESSIRRTIERNTLFNALGRLWEAALNIVLMAYILHHVTTAEWGLWGLVGIFTGYVALLDFGMSSGFAKYIAEYAARGEYDRVSNIVSTGLAAYALLGLFLLVLLWPGVDVLIWVVVHLRPGDHEAILQSAMTHDARFLLRGGLVLMMASNCVASFSAVQTGMQRMGISNLLGFVVSLVKIAATVAFLQWGYGVRGLLGVQFVMFAVFAVASVMIAYHLVPGLQITPRAVTRGALRKLFSFGWRAQVSRLSNIVSFQTDRLIVGAGYFQMDLVGVYSIGEDLAGKLRQAPSLLLSAIMPAASHLEARGDHERLRRLYLLSSKYVAAISVPMVALFVGAAGLIVRTVAAGKPDLETAIWVERIIALGYLANIIPGAGVSIALGMGRPDMQMKAGIIAMISNIGLSILLMLTIGFYGIPLGTTLSMVLASAWFIGAMRPVVGVGARELLHTSMTWPCLASLPGFLISLATDCALRNAEGRWSNLIALVFCTGAFIVTYATAIRFSPFLDAFDVHFILQAPGANRIPGLRHLLPARTPIHPKENEPKEEQA